MAKLPLYVYPRPGGYEVKKPRTPSKTYSASKLGGMAAALRKAAGAARRLVDRDRVNPKTRRFVHDPSKHGGVFRLVVKGYPFWVAKWQPKQGRSKQRRFSVGKFGEEGARAAARAERAKRVRELLG